MCQSILSRRQCLIAGAAATLATSLRAAEPREQSGSDEPFPTDGAAAVARLMEGNRRFVAGAPRHPHTGLSWRREIEPAQKPFATILSCSDSRVPPELLFDQGFGDLFVIRVAGHVIDPSTLGSLQYAFVHLKTPLFLVLGHEQCGAVTAAVEALTGKHVEPEKIQALVDLIEPGLGGLDLTGNHDRLVHEAVAANVRWTIQQLQELGAGHSSVEAHTVGAVYELEQGEVRLLEAS